MNITDLFLILVGILAIASVTLWMFTAVPDKTFTTLDANFQRFLLESDTRNYDINQFTKQDAKKPVIVLPKTEECPPNYLVYGITFQGKLLCVLDANGSSFGDLYSIFPTKPVGDANISEMSWIKLMNYPSGCSAGQFVSTIDDTLTCGTPSGSGGGNDGNVYSLGIMSKDNNRFLIDLNMNGKDIQNVNDINAIDLNIVHLYLRETDGTGSDFNWRSTPQGLEFYDVQGGSNLFLNRFDAITSNIDNRLDLGTIDYRIRDLWLAGTATIQNLFVPDFNLIWLKQPDANLWFAKTSDINSTYSKITDVNGADSLRAKTTDINGTYVKIPDGNIWYARVGYSNILGLLLSADFNALYARLGVASLHQFLYSADFNSSIYSTSHNFTKDQNFQKINVIDVNAYDVNIRHDLNVANDINGGRISAKKGGGQVLIIPDQNKIKIGSWCMLQTTDGNFQITEC